MLLFYLEKKEKEVEADVRKGVKNIQIWLDMLLLRKSYIMIIKHTCSKQESIFIAIQEVYSCGIRIQYIYIWNQRKYRLDSLIKEQEWVGYADSIRN